MPALFATDALLPSGWARDVHLEWNADGMFTRVVPASPSLSIPRAAGPVLPGMPNVHSHAFQRAMAGLAEFRGHPADDFWTWREAMYALVTRLEPEDVEAIAEHLQVEMLKHGYTAVAEFHYLHHDRAGNPYADRAELANRVIAAAERSGMRLTLLPVLYSYGGFGARPLNAAQRRFAGTSDSIELLLQELVQRHRARPALRFGVAPHSVRAVDALGLSEMIDGARRIDPGLPIHMHVAEQVAEVAEALRHHGATPFDWLAGIVEVDAHWTFIHATHLTDTERSRLAASGARVGLCPTTEANLGDGLFDFAAWFEHGAAWSIGGDSHVSVSPFEELRLLEYAQRLRLRQRNVSASMGAPDVAANLWRGACEGGAGALGQPIGRLAPGAAADFVVLDANDADFESARAPSALAIAMFSGNFNRVRDVFVAGRALVEHGHHARESEAAAAYRAALGRLRTPNRS